MIFYYPTRFAPFWDMVMKMTQDRYGDQSHDTVVLLATYLHEDIRKYRDLHPTSKIIIYQFEPLCGMDHWWNRDLIVKRLKQADEVWDYDYQNVVLLRLLGINAHFRPFLYSDAVKYNQSDSTRDIDFLFFGTLTDRRAHWLTLLSNAINTDMSLVVLTNIFQPQLDQYINRAKIVINLHHGDGVSQQEQPRIGWLLTNGKHVLTEKSAVNYYGDMVGEFSTYEELVDSAVGMLSVYDREREQDISNQFASMTLDQLTTQAQEQVQRIITL